MVSVFEGLFFKTNPQRKGISFKKPIPFLFGILCHVPGQTENRRGRSVRGFNTSAGFPQTNEVLVPSFPQQTQKQNEQNTV